MTTATTTTMAAHDGFLRTKSFGSLDGLRAASILGVVWHHTRPEPDAWVGAGRGFLGVDLFFAISGFLIVTLVLRERQRTGDVSLRDFYLRRFLRIFPLYYAVLLGTLAFSLLSSGDEAARIRGEIGFSFLYVANWVEMTSLLSITWSLSAEEQFYLLWPPLEKLIGTRSRVAIDAVILTLLIGVGALQLLHAHAGMFSSLPTFLAQTSFFPILLGVALAHLLHHPRSFGVVQRAVGFRGAPLVFLAVVGVLLAIPVDDISGGLRMAFHVTLWLLLASCVVREDHALAGLLKNPVLVRIGVLSYGMYLLHMLARHVAAKVLVKLGLADAHGGGWALFVVTLVATVAVAELSYRFYETPFLRLKKRFER